MTATVVGLNDDKAVKHWASLLSVAAFSASYWENSFIGEAGSSMPIQKRTELETSSGESISYDLNAQFTGSGSDGDAPVSAENLKFHTDKIYIDQKRHKFDAGGDMTQQRVLHDLRATGRDREADWWSRFFDEQIQFYLSGARGVTDGLLTPLGFTGRATNALTAPDVDHLAYGGAATSKATVAATDKMTLGLIDKMVAKANTMGQTAGVSQIRPIMVEGKKCFVLQMHDYQEYDLRTNATTGQWLDVQKAAAASQGKDNPIFKGGLGMYNNVVLHKHPNVVRFTDYGAGGNVEAARALFLGEQAGVIAFGGKGRKGVGNQTSGGARYRWYEQMENDGNNYTATTSATVGVKKATYNGKDYGVIAVDTAAAKPTGI